jgi:hypothetical protein
MDTNRAVICTALCRCDVGGRISVQLACYPGGGARYVRHTDASDAVPGRTVTALLYLNADWDAQVGRHRAAALLHSLHCGAQCIALHALTHP